MRTALLARRPSAGAVPGRRGACLAVRTPPAASCPEIKNLSSVIAVRDDFVASSCHQSGEDADVDGGLEKSHVAVREHDVRSVWVEAVDFALVRAIDGTGPVEGGPVRRRAPAKQQVPRSPRAAGELDVRDCSAPLPKLRPASAFRQQKRVHGAVLYILEARSAVGPED